MKSFYLIPHHSFIFRDGDDPPADPDPASTEEDKKFTQADVDRMMKKRWGESQDVKKIKEDHAKQLKELRENGALTEAERNTLSAKIEELETSMLTKEEQAAKKIKDAHEKASKEVSKATEERDTWRTRYTSSMVERALTDAAVSVDAISPAQIRGMYQSGAYLEESVGDDGKPNGVFVPKLRFKGFSEDKKKMVDFDLPVEDAIKKIKDDGLNANLFKGSQKPGTGSPPSGGSGGSGGNGQMPTLEQFNGDYAKFSEAYLAHKKASK